MNSNFQLFSLLGSVPILAVWFGGIILCIVRASRQPMACVLAGVAIAIAIGNRFVLPYVVNFALMPLLKDGDPETHVLVSSLIYSFASAVSWGLMLWALFGAGNSVSTTRAAWQNDVPRRV